MVNGVREEDQSGVGALHEVGHLQETAEGLPETDIDNGFGDWRNGSWNAASESGVLWPDEPQRFGELSIVQEIRGVL